MAGKARTIARHPAALIDHRIIGRVSSLFGRLTFDATEATSSKNFQLIILE